MQAKLQPLNSSMQKLFGKKYKKLVFGHGNAKAKIMLIGEAPGKEEEKQEKPFVGRAGKLLNETLEKAHIKKEKTYISNVTKFRPHKNRKPKKIEVKAFLPFLYSEIEIVKPKVICLLGSTATEALLGNYPATKNRGKILVKDKKRFLVTFHPAAVLRNQNLS